MRTGLPPQTYTADLEPTEEVYAQQWLERFHAGDRATLEACYREQFAAIKRSMGSIVEGADREAVIHELFSALIARAELRTAFRGGNFTAWLVTTARNRAIDYRRRSAREAQLRQHSVTESARSEWEEATQARLLVEQFRRTHLPVGWEGVFELRFLQQIPQRDAARSLAMHRTTLAYRELRIRALLRRFLLDEPSALAQDGIAVDTDKR